MGTQTNCHQCRSHPGKRKTRKGPTYPPFHILHSHRLLSQKDYYKFLKPHWLLGPSSLNTGSVTDVFRSWITRLEMSVLASSTLGKVKPRPLLPVRAAECTNPWKVVPASSPRPFSWLATPTNASFLWP